MSSWSFLLKERANKPIRPTIFPLRADWKKVLITCLLITCFNYMPRSCYKSHFEGICLWRYMSFLQQAKHCKTMLNKARLQEKWPKAEKYVIIYLFYLQDIPYFPLLFIFQMNCKYAKHNEVTSSRYFL